MNLVAGAGYVGLSLAVLLAKRNRVVAVVVVPDKVEAICAGRSSIVDPEIELALASGTFYLKASFDGRAAKADAKFVVIVAPANYDLLRNFFETSLVEEVIDLVLAVNPDAVMAIKSTASVGYTKSLCERYPQGHFLFLFSPEFLREGRALFDNLHPSRIIVGVSGGSVFQQNCNWRRVFC